MNPFIIINKDGYRYEDLTEENKKVIDWLNNLLDDIDGFTTDYELTLNDEIFKKEKLLKAEKLDGGNEKNIETLEESSNDRETNI